MERKAKAISGTSLYGYLLDRKPITEINKLYKKEFYNLLKLAFMSGKAYSIVTSSIKDELGNPIRESVRKMWLNFLS